jgi:cytoskeletal protein RodZ
MSLEQAITDHAAAIRELAAAILGRVSAATISTAPGHSIAQAAAKAASKTEPTDAQIDAEIDAAVTKVEADAKPNAARAVIEQKLAEARAAKNAGSAAGTATAAADTQTTAGAADIATAEAQTSYDYAKDVAPVLTKVAQKSRDSLVALLATFGAKKGNELKPEQYIAVLADANKLLVS